MIVFMPAVFNIPKDLNQRKHGHHQQDGCKSKTLIRKRHHTNELIRFINNLVFTPFTISDEHSLNLFKSFTNFNILPKNFIDRFGNRHICMYPVFIDHENTFTRIIPFRHHV